MAVAASVRALSGQAIIAFGLFGSFWGVWGASVPRIQRQVGVDDGQLGLALLCVGAAALPAMMVGGQVIDRVGLRVAGIALPTMCVAGALTSVTAHSPGHPERRSGRGRCRQWRV